jgi:hypothetical protein
MAKIKRRDESFYRKLREAFSRSGKSQREFAQECGVPAGTLSGWFHKLRKLDAARGRRARRPSRSSRRAERPQGADGPPVQQASPFLPVHVVPSAEPTARAGAGYELVLARGVLRLPSDFDPARVAALLRAAEVTC